MADPTATTVERSITVITDDSHPAEIIVNNQTPTVAVDPATSPEPVTGAPERLVKSAERVRDLGEVFTPATTVQAMLDLLPESMWAPHPSATFFEPACGDGNFLVEILERKLAGVATAYTANTLPAGATVIAAQLHALEALASVYAVDISVDNIIGGTPGHEIGARSRLFTQFTQWHQTVLGKHLSSRSPAWRSAQWIVEHNILVGNMLATGADGQPTGRNELPIMEYTWDPQDGNVTIHGTTFGALMSDAESNTTGVLPLFGPPIPTLLWSGKAAELHKAPKTTSALSEGPARNGKGCERR